MMLATPVLSSAWSSTSMTVAGLTDVSDGNVHLRGQRCRLPGEDHFRTFPQPRHDRERRADPIRALLHAGHSKPGRGGLVGNHPAAVVGDGQAEADGPIGLGANRDSLRARVAYRVGERFLSD